MTDITTSLSGVEFSTSSDAAFTIAALDGWYSGPSVRSVTENRPTANGAFGVAQVYKAPRVITQTGLILGGTADAAMADPWLTFAAIQSDGRPSLFTVTDGSGTKSAEVTLADAPEITPLVDGTAAYVLQMVARDPIRYGETSSSATGLPSSGGGLEYNLFSGGAGGALYYGSLGNLGRVTLTNSGTAEVWPSVAVTGTLDAGFYIQCLETGQVVRYDRVVPAGTEISINFRTGEVLIDGQSDASTYLTRDEFFSVGPGESVTAQFNAISGSSGSPTATFLLAPGWW